jgi:hypothetical protein
MYFVARQSVLGIGVRGFGIPGFSGSWPRGFRGLVLGVLRETVLSSCGFFASFNFSGGT